MRGKHWLAVAAVAIVLVLIGAATVLWRYRSAQSHCEARIHTWFQACIIEARPLSPEALGGFDLASIARFSGRSVDEVRRVLTSGCIFARMGFDATRRNEFRLSAVNCGSHAVVCISDAPETSGVVAFECDGPMVARSSAIEKVDLDLVTCNDCAWPK